MNLNRRKFLAVATSAAAALALPSFSFAQEAEPYRITVAPDRKYICCAWVRSSDNEEWRQISTEMDPEDLEEFRDEGILNLEIFTDEYESIKATDDNTLYIDNIQVWDATEYD